MNSNLPPGATNHPNAPWNERDTTCYNCESDIVSEMVDKYLAEHPDCKDWDEAYEKLDESGAFSLCRDCYCEDIMWEYNGDD